MDDERTDQQPANGTSASPARRRVSRWTMAAVAGAALITIGAGVWLHQATDDRAHAVRQLTGVRTSAAAAQVSARGARSELAQSVAKGDALNSALHKPMATFGQLNALDKNIEGLMAPLLRSGEAGAAGVDAWNQQIDATNADAEQANALLQQLLAQSGSLPAD